jgi:hypothetical protein
MEPIKSKTARGRAGAAARMLKHTKVPHERGYRWGLGRRFDDCFEMGDGAEVKRLLIEKAKSDPVLLNAFRRHSHHIPKDWYDEARMGKSDADVFFAA